MKKLFIFILSFPLLPSFGQSTNSFCAFNQNGEKYELNLVDGTGSLTFVQYNRSGVIVKTVSGTWSMRDEGVYGPFERLTVNIPVGQMKFLVVRTSRGAIQELQDESAYKRNFQPCTGIFSGGSNQTQKKIEYNLNASMIIGTPITIGKLKVAQFDFPQQLSWEDAKKMCDLLADGWRLPTKQELDILHQNKSTIGGFEDDYYWSSTESDDNHGWAWLKLFFTDHTKDGYQTDLVKSSTFYVRAVKTLNPVKKSIGTPSAKPVVIEKTIKIGNLEVAQFDFPEEMIWVDAKAACAKLGKGWRLPTKAELNILFRNKTKIGGFKKDAYWSSTGNEKDGEAWNQSFDGGDQYNSASGVAIYVRAVRSF